MRSTVLKIIAPVILPAPFALASGADADAEAMRQHSDKHGQTRTNTDNTDNTD